MKRLTALLLCCFLMLTCCMTARADDEPTLHDVRYYFEHRLLPNELHNNAAELVHFLQANGLYRLWMNFTEANNLDTFYTEDEFSLCTLTDVRQGENAVLIRLTMPVPEDTPLCLRIYMYWDPDTGKTGYYTIEYDNFFGDTWFLCSWDKDGNHMDYGTIDTVVDPADPGYQNALDMEFEKILELLEV